MDDHLATLQELTASYVRSAERSDLGWYEKHLAPARRVPAATPMSGRGATGSGFASPRTSTLFERGP